MSTQILLKLYGSRLSSHVFKNLASKSSCKCEYEWEKKKDKRDTQCLIIVRKKLIEFPRGILLHNVCIKMAVVRKARKCWREIWVLIFLWIVLAALLSFSALRASNSAIWPALKKTLVFPICNYQDNWIREEAELRTPY